MIELTEKQRQELGGPEPTRVIDPNTSERYVLVREALYERMRSIFDESSETIEVGKLIEETMREYDQDDPLLESYERYRQ
jgi:hypothetical protein